MTVEARIEFKKHINDRKHIRDDFKHIEVRRISVQSVECKSNWQVHDVNQQKHELNRIPDPTRH